METLQSLVDALQVINHQELTMAERSNYCILCLANSMATFAQPAKKRRIVQKVQAVCPSLGLWFSEAALGSVCQNGDTTQIPTNLLKLKLTALAPKYHSIKVPSVLPLEATFVPIYSTICVLLCFSIPFVYCQGTNAATPYERWAVQVQHLEHRTTWS